MTKLTPFYWYGGKTSHLKFLLPLINSTPHSTYVESFGGSAAVLLNKEPSGVEVYNDIYSDVVNFFRILRDKKDELIESISLTPYSREEFADSCAENECDLLSGWHKHKADPKYAPETREEGRPGPFG